MTRGEEFVHRMCVYAVEIERKGVDYSLDKLCTGVPEYGDSCNDLISSKMFHLLSVHLVNYFQL